MQATSEASAAAAYLRVSSRSQDLRTQRATIERAALARGHENVRWYEETASGRALARPELDRLRHDVRAGQVGVLYVYKLDRLTRSGIRDTLALLEELGGGGARVVSVCDGFDLQGPMRDVVVAVMAWAAQMERLAIGERVSSARQRVEAAGGAWGRPRVLGVDVVERARQLRAQGVPIRSVAEQLAVRRSTLARALSRKGGSERGPKSLRKC